MASSCSARNRRLIILVSFLVFHTFCSTNFLLANAADLIDDICTHVPADPAFCKTAFHSDPRSAKADLPTLGQVGIDLALKNTQSSVTMLNSMTKSATDEKLKSALAACLKDYGQTSSGLKDCTDALKKKDYAGMNIHASAALDGPVQCDDNFSKPPPPEPAELKQSNKHVQALCSAVAYIANQLKGK